MEYAIIDFESNGLLDKVTKIHCLSYAVYEGKKKLYSGSITDYKQMEGFLLNQKIIVGHNIICYDIPLAEKILGIKITAELIDTLGISYYHYPVAKFKHGLGPWGERLGFGKPVVEDWENQPIEVYIKRCESDVEINTRLFHFQMDYTMSIYDNDLKAVKRLYKYLGFKLDCLKEQEEVKIKLNLALAEESKLNLEFLIEEKISNLSMHMPRVVDKTVPKKMYKANGELSALGERWNQTLLDNGLTLGTKELTSPGNPGSSPQLKSWLFSLGWEPKTFKLNAKGEKIEQVSLPFGQGLCHSIKDLFEEHPFLEELAGLYRARHRYGLFKSFLQNKDENDYIYSGAQGFTNTLRLQHKKPIANLPGVDKFYGKEVRGCLTVPSDAYTMCGSDISGLEDNTKQHYIYFYDPQYVIDMRVPGFDPHIDIAVLANMITKEDEEFYKKVVKDKAILGDNFSFTDEAEAARFKKISKVRSNAKVVNFSATYGAGAPKIAETLKCDLAFATKLHKTYWKRNAAVKQTAKDCKVKLVGDQKWLYNPVSKFWMFLKAEKDRFSTLNQSTGVFVFDTWLSNVRARFKKLGIKVCLQYHDELLFYCMLHNKDEAEACIKDAMEQLNATLGLNVSISYSVDWGNSYADCH